ncbi:hypothetical protein FHW79_004158 [Azospirillum sp. OGB3]|uniref:hypothetical protein n=1 Tax=Azospirillum sp. OGB3 TaxID=2587012 RepID=UPI0016064F61|nr:hypothetical protein [Azospirillum sp. OGB3]MBB3266517.1 hypothetical protein [Azospirillum sp. OGB3]
MLDKAVAAALSSLLLLGAAAAHADGAQVAELVPVNPPTMYYPAPSSGPAPAPRTVAPSAPSAPAAADPTEKTGPAELEDGWEGGPSRDRDGKFAYCAIEGRFDTGHVLMIARNVKGEVNLGMGIPGAELPGGEQWKVKVVVDGKLTRERRALAPKPDMLVIPNGKDEELYTALMNGKEVVFASDADRMSFALKGTKKVLTDLKTCVDKAGAVPPIDTRTKKVATRPDELPEGLADLLKAAGVRDVKRVSLENVPKGERPADMAWRIGPIVGGIRERMVEEGSKLEDLSAGYVDAMKKRCEGGTPTASLSAVEDLPGLMLRTGSVDCALKEGKMHVSLTFFLSPGRLFTILFHEAQEADIGLADKVRDNLAEVLRRLAVNPPSAQPSSGQSPAAPVPAQTGKP